MSNVVQMAEHRRPMAVALRLCATLDGPLHREFPWAKYARDLDGVYAAVIEQQERLVLPLQEVAA